jgi:hypothetical protein
MATAWVQVGYGAAHFFWTQAEVSYELGCCALLADGDEAGGGEGHFSTQ